MRRLAVVEDVFSRWDSYAGSDYLGAVVVHEVPEELALGLLTIYIERMAEDVKAFKDAARVADAKDAAGVPFITREGALRMVEAFQSQRRDAEAVLGALEGGEEDGA